MKLHIIHVLLNLHKHVLLSVANFQFLGQMQATCDLLASNAKHL